MATIAEAFQRSLLPERLPEVAGLASSARYMAGPTDAQVGGDWYDLIALRDGLAGIAIGDVVGSGLEAAANMARLQNALRVYAVDGLRPSVALERMNSFAREAAGGPAATVLYSIIDPENGRMDLASAGHPPPLIIGPHGDAWFADGPAGTPLGVARYPVYEETTISLEPGATVLLYTDGLIERPGVSLDEGLEWLRGRVSSSMTSTISAPCSCAPPVTRRLRQTTSPCSPFVSRRSSQSRSSSRLRLSRKRWPTCAGSWGDGCGRRARTTTRHTRSSSPAERHARTRSLTPTPRGIPPPTSLRRASATAWSRSRSGTSDCWRTRVGSEGGGLRLISQLADELELDRAATGTVVRMRRAVRAPPPQAPQGHR